MKGECNVARDLMPLCIDGAASRESEAYVDGHVEECETCRVYYEDMKNRLPESVRRQAAEEGEAFARAAARARRRHAVRRALVVALAAIVLLGGAVGGHAFFNQQIDLPTSWYNVTLSQLEDGQIIVTMCTTKKVTTAGFGYGTTMNDDLILTAKESDEAVLRCWLSGFRFGHRADKYDVTAFSVSSLDDDIQAIVYGRTLNGEKPAVVWRKGEEIPPASKEMEAYYAAVKEAKLYQNEAWARQKAEAIERGGDEDSFLALPDEENAEIARLWDVVREARQAVPEWGAGNEEYEVSLMG